MDICIDKQVLKIFLGDSLYNQFPSHWKITRNKKLRISSFLIFKPSSLSEQIVTLSNVEHSLQQLCLPVRKKNWKVLQSLTGFLVPGFTYIFQHKSMPFFKFNSFNLASFDHDALFTWQHVVPHFQIKLRHGSELIFPKWQWLIHV